MPENNMLRIAVIGTWQDVLEAQRKVKKFAADGLYVEVSQLTDEAVKSALLDLRVYATLFKNQFTPRLAAARRKTFDIEYFLIEVWGPKVTTPKPNRFFILQQNEDGSFTPSIPMSESRARQTLKGGRGVISYLCEVKETFDGRRPR